MYDVSPPPAAARLTITSISALWRTTTTRTTTNNNDNDKPPRCRGSVWQPGNGGGELGLHASGPRADRHAVFGAVAHSRRIKEEVGGAPRKRVAARGGEWRQNRHFRAARRRLVSGGRGAGDGDAAAHHEGAHARRRGGGGRRLDGAFVDGVWRREGGGQGEEIGARRATLSWIRREPRMRDVCLERLCVSVLQHDWSCAHALTSRSGVT